MPPLPAPFRAAVGLAATIVEQARNFPDRAIEVPMLAVSTALQVSLRAQQRYAQLTARGDEVLHRAPTGDEPPPWARFDELPPPESLNRSSNGSAAHDPSRSPGRSKPSRFDNVDDD